MMHANNDTCIDLDLYIDQIIFAIGMNLSMGLRQS